MMTDCIDLVLYFLPVLNLGMSGKRISGMVTFFNVYKLFFQINVTFLHLSLCT